jgi:predicted esterase
MAINIFGNQPNSVVAKTDATFFLMGLTVSNTEIVYLVGNPLKSWKPERLINGITGIENGKGYYIVPKIDLDLSNYFVPPVPTGGSGDAIDLTVNQDESLPANTTQIELIGVAEPAPGRTVESTYWLLIASPSGRPLPTIVDQEAAITMATGLYPGVYIFQFQAIDDNGNTAYKQFTLTIEQPDEIIVDAGPMVRLDQDVNTGVLHGSAVPSGESEIVSVQWSVVTSGVVGVTFTAPTAFDTGFSGVPVATLETGNLDTVMRLTVTDNFGGTFHDDVVVRSLKPSQMYVITGWDPDRLTQGMQVYEPQGYDGVEPRGLYIHLHGMGENGDTTVPPDDVERILDQSAGVPYFIANKIFPVNFCMIAPQLHTGTWSLAYTQKALLWAQNNLALDLNRIYAGGPSSGGGGSLDLPAENPNLFKAAIPAAPTYSVVGDPGTGALVKNVAFLFVHGCDDTAIPNTGDHSTIDCIDSINSADPKGYFPPECIMVWDGVHGPITWNDNCWDKRRAAFDFEKDFLDLYAGGIEDVAGRFVDKAELTKKWIEYSKAFVLCTRIPNSTAKTAFLARLAAIRTQWNTEGKRHFMVNLGGTATFNMYTVNSVASTTAGTTVALQDFVGGASAYSFEVVSQPLAPVTDGQDGYYMGMGNDMFKTSFRYTGTEYNPTPNPASHKFTGLDNSKVYDLYIYNSSRNLNQKNSFKRSGSHININGRCVQSQFEIFNSRFLTSAYNIPPVSGEIVMDFSTLYNYDGNVVAICLVERPSTTVTRALQGKWNMTLGLPSPAQPDWAHLTGDPTVLVRTAADPVSGWTISTVSTASNYWNKLYFSFYADDNLFPAVAPGAMTPPVDIPEAIARSGRYTYETHFDKAIENFNLEILGIPGLGLPQGRYQLRLFGGTSNAEGGICPYYVRMGKGLQEIPLQTLGNQNQYVTFEGYLTEGETIKIAIQRPQSQTAFINAIILERVGDI